MIFRCDINNEEMFYFMKTLEDKYNIKFDNLDIYNCNIIIDQLKNDWDEDEILNRYHSDWYDEGYEEGYEEGYDDGYKAAGEY